MERKCYICDLVHECFWDEDEQERIITCVTTLSKKVLELEAKLERYKHIEKAARNSILGCNYCVKKYGKPCPDGTECRLDNELKAALEETHE